MMPVRNEAWIVGFSLRAALRWCDSVVVLDHASIDETPALVREIATEYPGRVVILEDSDPTWTEMQHRSIMLAAARGMEATHLAIVDADEVLTANVLGTVRDSIQAIPRGAIVQLPGYNLRGDLFRYHSNGIWGKRWFSVAFADDKRLNWAGDRFHHREPMGLPLVPCKTMQQGAGGIMHLWGASEERLHQKHRCYKISERLRWPEKPVAEIERLYSLAEHGQPGHPTFGTPETWQYAEVPSEWWNGYGDIIDYLHLDAEPWQKAWCDAMIERHGIQRFAGLTL